MKIRFLGKLERDAADNMPQKGDVCTFDGPLERTYLYVYCEVCNDIHSVPIKGNSNTRWEWNEATLTLTPSVRITMPPTTYCCHFNITNGEFILHGDSVAKT